ncbi:MAG TPA: 2'-5' RNA ligase family protein [Chthoniobacterales bacterium]
MIAFWLTPAAGAREFFEGVINQLGERYDAPRFEPHLTLCGGNLPAERAPEILRNLSIREEIELEVQGVEFSDKYTKTLFLQFASTPQLEALSNELKKAVGSDYELNPHLSLIYKEMPREQKAEAARAISLPFSTVQFETVKAIETPTPITSAADIAVWRTLASRRLDSAPE